MTIRLCLLHLDVADVVEIDDDDDDEKVTLPRALVACEYHRARKMRCPGA
jgi:hypothetical protein